MIQSLMHVPNTIMLERKFPGNICGSKYIINNFVILQCNINSETVLPVAFLMI